MNIFQILRTPLETSRLAFKLQFLPDRVAAFRKILRQVLIYKVVVEEIGEKV